MRALKFLLIAAIIGGVLLLSCLSLLPMGCNTSFVKGRLNQAMQDSKQRTLSIDGELSCSWSLSPAAAVVVHLGHASLSEHASAQPFASLENMKATLRLWPLLSGQFILDGIELDGLKVSLLRHRDGTLNIADLLGADKPDSTLPPFAIGGVHVSNTALEWQDETTGQRLKLGDLQLLTGHLANAAADALDFSVRLKMVADDGSGSVIGIKTKARYDYDLTQKRFAIGKLEAQLNSPRLGNLREVALQLDIDNLAGDAQVLRAGRLVMQFAAQTGMAKGEIRGRLASSFAIPLPAKTLDLPDFSGELDIAALPALTVGGPISIDLSQQTAAGKFTGRFDDSRISAKVELIRFQPLSLDFAIAIDKLDLDRYLPASREPAPGHAASLDTAFLDKLDLRGTLDIAHLHVARAKMRNVRLAIRKAIDGRLEIAMPAK